MSELQSPYTYPENIPHDLIYEKHAVQISVPELMPNQQPVRVVTDATLPDGTPIPPHLQWVGLTRHLLEKTGKTLVINYFLFGKLLAGRTAVCTVRVYEKSTAHGDVRYVNLIETPNVVPTTKMVVVEDNASGNIALGGRKNLKFKALHTHVCEVHEADDCPGSFQNTLTPTELREKAKCEPICCPTCFRARKDAEEEEYQKQRELNPPTVNLRTLLADSHREPTVQRRG